MLGEVKRKRDQQIKFYVDAEEKAAFQARVAASGLSIGEYIRRTVLGEKIVLIEGLNESIRDARKALLPVGNNLNQLTRAVNAGRTDCREDVLELRKEVREIWLLLNQLRQGNR
jgi:hypothetical protein